MESFELLKLLEELKSLKADIKKLESAITEPQESPYSSKDIKDLATALSKAQGEYKTIAFNRENRYYNQQYTDLDGIMKIIRPILSKHGLAFIQQTKINKDNVVMLHSILMHSSGQWIECRNRIIPLKNTHQEYGSAIKYNRRYAAESLLNITTESDDLDDDAEITMADSRYEDAKGTALNTNYNPKEQSYEPITKEQLEELEYELTEFPDIALLILEGMKIQSLADLPKSKFIAAINRVRKIKQLRKGEK